MKNIFFTLLFILGGFFYNGLCQSTTDDLLGVACIVTTDKQMYTVGENIAITLSLKNTGSSPVTLSFPTGCPFDYYIDYSYHLLQGAFCSALYWDLVLDPGEVYTKTYTHKSNQYLIGAGFHQIKGISQSMPSYFGTTTIQVTSQLPAIQTLIIPAGWSGISSYLNPANSSLVSIMAPVVNNLEVVKNYSNTYSPPQGINPTAPWNPASGYYIKMDEPVQLNFNGFEIQNRTVSLSAGWNLIPVLSSQNVNIETLFSGQSEKVEFIKEAVGYKVYWPEKQIMTLVEFEPGKSYLVKMLQPATISF